MLLRKYLIGLTVALSLLLEPNLQAANKSCLTALLEASNSIMRTLFSGSVRKGQTRISTRVLRARLNVEQFENRIVPTYIPTSFGDLITADVTVQQATTHAPLSGLTVEISNTQTGASYFTGVTDVTGHLHQTFENPDDSYGYDQDFIWQYNPDTNSYDQVEVDTPASDLAYQYTVTISGQDSLGTLYRTIQNIFSTDFGSYPYRITGTVLDSPQLPPVLDAISPQVATELKTFSLQTHAADSDGDAITYSLQSAPSGAFINPNTGVFTWTPFAFQAPGVYSITVSATDVASPPLTDSKTFTLTVNGNGPELATLPFTDDFSGDTDIIGARWNPNQGVYFIESGKAVAPQGMVSISTLNGVSAADVVVSADMNWGGNTSPGLIARYNGADADRNMYLAQGSGQQLLIYKNVNGAWTKLGAVTVNTTFGNVEFSAIGPVLSLRFNGALVLQVEDSSITAAGDVGMRSYGGTLDNFAAGVAAFTPVTLPFADDFNSNSKILGLPFWRNKVAGFSIQNGQVVAPTGVVALATLNGVSASDVVVSANMSWAGGVQPGLIARYSGAGDRNMYLAKAYGQGLYLLKNVNGVWTQLASISVNVTSGNLEFSVVGNVLSLKLNGNLILQAEDGSLPGPGAVGIRAVGGHYDQFSADLTVANPASLPFSTDFSQLNDGSLLGFPSWRDNVGRFSIQSGQVVGKPGVNAIATLSGVSAVDVVVAADMSWLGGSQPGLIARYSGPGDSNMYLAKAYGKSLYLFKNVKGAWTQLGTVAVNATSGRLEFSVIGSTLALRLNGILVLQAEDSSITTAGKVGIRGPGGRYDNFQASVGIAPTPVTLPAFVDFSAPGTNILGSPTWNDNVGTFTIQNGQAVGKPGVNSIATLNGVSAADVTVSADMFWGNGAGPGLIARYSGPGDRNMYFARAYGQQLSIYKNVNGAWTFLGSISAGAGVTSGRLEFSAIGSTLTLKLNNRLMLQVKDVSIIGAGKAGIRGAGGRYDNFGADVAVPTPVTLPYTDHFAGTDFILGLPSWIINQGSFQLKNGQAVATSGIVSIATLNGVLSADVTISANLTWTGGAQPGLVARYSGVGDRNMYLAKAYGNQLYVYKNLNGIWTKLGSKVVSGTSGMVTFSVIGNHLTLLLNGTIVLDLFDNSITGAGGVGMRGYGGSFDEFSAD